MEIESGVAPPASNKTFTLFKKAQGSLNNPPSDEFNALTDVGYTFDDPPQDVQALEQFYEELYLRQPRTNSCLDAQRCDNHATYDAGAAMYYDGWQEFNDQYQQDY
jgi:hypothetical protein